MHNCKLLHTFVSALKTGNKNISTNILRGILLFGIFVAFLAMSTSSIKVSETLCDSQEIEQSQEEKSGTEKQEVVSSYEAITSSPQINLEHQFLLLDVLPELESEEKSYVPTDHQSYVTDKVLKILFRRIISPNAP